MGQQLQVEVHRGVLRALKPVNKSGRVFKGQAYLLSGVVV